MKYVCCICKFKSQYYMAKTTEWDTSPNENLLNFLTTTDYFAHKDLLITAMFSIFSTYCPVGQYYSEYDIFDATVYP